MERYEAYKDSGVEWIGAIPDNWKLRRLKLLGATRSGMGNKKPDDFGSGKPFLSYKDVYTRESFCDATGLVESTEEDRSKFSVERGDAFFTGSSETIEELGFSSVCLSTVPEATFNGFTIRFRPRGKDLWPEFSVYLFRSDVFRGYLSQRDNSITRANLSQQTLGNAITVLPSEQEQRGIANYLDAKIAEIDTLVADCEREVELLQKYRNAVISEAVTKGIDSDAPMKDSGVEWIGEIPEGWTVQPSKTLFAEGKELRHPDDEQCAATQKYGIIPQAQYIALENQRMVAADKNLDSWKHVEPGDFVISLRSFQGGLELSTVAGCVTWHYIVLKKTDLVDTGYYKYLFKTQKYIESLQRTCTYIRDGQDLRYSNFIQVPLPLPTLNEQRVSNFNWGRADTL